MEENKQQSEAAKAANYNRSYYEKNKERLAKRKADRYKNDPEYRAKIIAARARQREREKVARKKRRDKRVEVPFAERNGKRMRVADSVGEMVVVKMFRSSQFAFRVAVTVQTLRKWEKEGVLPKPTYRSQGNHRLYTQWQVLAVADVVDKWRSASDIWRLTDEFVKDLHDEWNKYPLGVPVGEVDEDE